MSTFPSADQIAAALCAAATLHSEDPIATLHGEMGMRGRHVAFAALIELFPDAVQPRLARLCGYATPSAASPSLRSAKRASWWNDEHVLEVIGAVVGPEYGEQAT